MLSGRFSSTMASLEPMTVVPFRGRLGTVRVTQPVQTRIFFPSRTFTVPSAAFTSTLPGEMMEASPVTESTLFFLKKEPHAAGQAVADLAGTADHFAPIHADALHRHAEFPGAVRHDPVGLRVFQKRLGGDAPPSSDRYPLPGRVPRTPRISPAGRRGWRPHSRQGLHQ